MDFKEEYKNKLTTADGIATQVEPDWVCCSDIALAVPYAICDAIGRRVEAEGLTGVTLHTMLDTRPLSFFSKEYREKLAGVSWFSGAGQRKAVNGGWADLMPQANRLKR